MFFPRTRFNQAVARALQLLPVTVSAAAAPGRPHPWQPTATWLNPSGVAGSGRWVCVVEPGLVNGLPAAMRLPLAQVPPDAQARIRKDAELAGKRRPADEDLVDAFLDERPQMPLFWRSIGTGAGGEAGEQDGELVVQYEPVPAFFKRLGVADAEEEVPPGTPVRYLKASDVVLNQPRTASFAEVEVGSVVGGNLVSVQPGYFSPPDRQARVESFSKFVPPPPADSPDPRDVLFGLYRELPLDQVHLATVYALSAYNPPSEDLDGNWTIFVRQNVHWNLAHTTAIAEAVRVPPVTLFTGLAAGIGDTLFNFILANNNDFAQAAANLLAANRQPGRFHAV